MKLRPGAQTAIASVLVLAGISGLAAMSRTQVQRQIAPPLVASHIEAQPAPVGTTATVAMAMQQSGAAPDATQSAGRTAVSPSAAAKAAVAARRPIRRIRDQY